jgi:hypothetical protein
MRQRVRKWKKRKQLDVRDWRFDSEREGRSAFAKASARALASDFTKVSADKPADKEAGMNRIAWEVSGEGAGLEAGSNISVLWWRTWKDFLRKSLAGWPESIKRCAKRLLTSILSEKCIRKKLLCQYVHARYLVLYKV